MDLLVTILAVIATLLGSAMALPQVRRIARTRRVEGVSAVWIGVSVSLNGWWIAYAWVTGLWLLLPVSTFSALLYLAMAAFFVRTVGRRGFGGLLLGAAGLGMTPLPVLLLGGWTLAGLAVGLSYGLQLLPAVVGVLRTRQLAGVSVGTWAIAWLEAAMWLVVGIGVADLAVIIGGASGALMAAIILTRLAVTGHIARPRLPVVPRRFVPGWTAEPAAARSGGR